MRREESILDIVFCIENREDAYCRHLAVVMVSVMENTKDEVNFHILCDENLSKENQKKLENLAKRYRSQIYFYFVILPMEMRTLSVVRFLSKGALYKFLVADVLPKNVEKVLYLDTDLIVHLDIKELFSICVDNYAIAAVKDTGVKTHPDIYHREIHVNLNKYFNSGVILFNLKKMRQNYELCKQASEVLGKYPNEPFVDQPPFNYILQNDCLFLDDKYNTFPNAIHKTTDRCIFHFAGAYKPWKSRNFPVDQLYWKYFLLTPWGEDTKDIFKYYSRTVETLDRALLTYPTGSKRKFFRSVMKRCIREIIDIRKRFYRHLF